MLLEIYFLLLFTVRVADLIIVLASILSSGLANVLASDLVGVLDSVLNAS
ncbi:hypothetical protein HW555_006700 [Spodoptera exigua]|uniref:Uncharacterized protein n=1 Tax=Spodoptera exigua TaxID=7107 RepID=A0A835GG26_SPOEX|nr:hypothetical protein HW555_006700 [Spodoptera exigua]